MTTTKTITIRMPADLAAQIEQLAKLEHRSTNQQIVVLIEAAIFAYQCSKQQSV